MTGRAAQGLPPVPWNSQQPIDVTQPAIRQHAAGELELCGGGAADLRARGLPASAVLRRRRQPANLVGRLELRTAAFGDDAVIELVVPPAAGPTEISKITFDELGRMYLADRPAPTGAFDFEVLAVPAIGRVLRYAVTETMPDGRRIWQQQPDQLRHRISATLPQRQWRRRHRLQLRPSRQHCLADMRRLHVDDR